MILIDIDINIVIASSVVFKALLILSRKRDRKSIFTSLFPHATCNLNQCYAALEAAYHLSVFQSIVRGFLYWRRNYKWLLLKCKLSWVDIVHLLKKSYADFVRVIKSNLPKLRPQWREFVQKSWFITHDCIFISKNSVEDFHAHIKTTSAIKYVAHKINVNFLYVPSTVVAVCDFNFISFSITCLSKIKYFHFIFTHRVCLCCKTCCSWSQFLFLTYTQFYRQY